MNKYKETFGVEINKDVFDVHGSISRHQQYKNDEQALRGSSKSYQ
jgi:transposase